MAISITAAHNNVMSERYNKKNVLIYMVLVTLASVFSVFYYKNTAHSILAAALLINVIIIFIGAGISPLAIHNRFRDSDNIFPSIISDIKNILLTAIKNIAGALIVSIILGGVLGVIIFLAFKLNLFAGIIILIILFFLYILLLTGLYSQFLSTLDLKDWFDFKNALYLIKNNYNSFCIYYFKTIILYILAWVSVSILVFIVSTILTALFYGNSEALNITSSIIGIIIGSVISTFIALYAIDITGQFLKELIPKAE